ncbi:MAG: hypothetical protein K0U41_06655 [Gammaproteobacteria bacterium]|nr:hypothetical protein [Gammaproteobacteria bacterium]
MTQTPAQLVESIKAFLATNPSESDKEKLYASLAGESPTPITKAELTTGGITTSPPPDPGVLDCIIKTIRLELIRLVEDSRLTQKELGLILGESLGGITNAAVQFTLTKDSAYWDSVTSQRRSEIALQELEIAKTNAAIAQAKLDQEQFQEAVLQAQVCDTVKVPKFRMVSPGVFTRDTDTSGNQLFEDKTINPATGSSEGLIGRQKDLLLRQKGAYDDRVLLDYAGIFTEAFAVAYSSDSAGNDLLLGNFDLEKTKAALKLVTDKIALIPDA